MRGFELISRRTGSEASYYLFDGGMSVRGITDEDGSLTDTLVFDAFGNEVERTGTTENSYGFQGEEQDETGLYYLRARYMDPATGTFTSMDTYGGSLEDPMSLHKYLFANSNPVKWCDPSGHMTLAEFDMTAAIDSLLESSVMYLLDWVVNDPESESHSFWGLLGHASIGLLTGGFGGVLSDAMGAEKLFQNIIYKFNFGLKLSRAETIKIFAICLLSVFLVPVGISLKVCANNCKNEYIGDFLDGFADVFLDTYYVLLSEILGCPPACVPAIIDIFEMTA